MKRLLIIMLTFITLGVNAQETAVSKKEKLQTEKAQLKNLDVEKMASMKTKEITEHLKLNKEQEEKVYALYLVAAKLRKESIDARRSKSDKSDEIDKKRKEAKIEFKSEMETILTAEQFKIWQSSKNKS